MPGTNAHFAAIWRNQRAITYPNKTAIPVTNGGTTARNPLRNALSLMSPSGMKPNSNDTNTALKQWNMDRTAKEVAL